MATLGMEIACCAVKKTNQYLEIYVESSFVNFAGKTNFKND